MRSETETYSESLPVNCPPPEAHLPEDGMEVIRLVNQDPPDETDFKSFRSLHPSRKAPTTECEACGLSVYTSQSDAERLRKLPKFKDSLPCVVRLSPLSGRIKQTNQPSHHTWWPSSQFNILTNCEIRQS